MSDIFTAKDGKRYFKDSTGAYREVNTSTDLGVPSVPRKENNALQPPARSYSGDQQGGFGHTAPNACDDPAYIQRHYPNMIGTDGEPIEHAGSANHPLNQRQQYQTPYQPQPSPEELRAIWAAEDAEKESKQ
jgi:hypothetical protein